MSSSSACERIEPRPSVISRASPASASASSTLERMERCSSSSETRPASLVLAGGGVACSVSVGCEMTTLAGAAGVAAGGASTSACFMTAAKAWVTISGTSFGSRPFSRRLYLTAMEASISFTTAVKASMMPMPSAAIVGKAARFQGFSSLSSSATVIRSGRSCLLYCTTSGTFSGTRRLASRFTFMFSKAAWFSLSALRRRVGHEDDRIRSGQNHPAGRVVLHLAGDRVELDLEVVAGHGAQAEGQQVEEQRPVLGGVERDQAVGASRSVIRWICSRLVVLPDWAGP